MVRPRIRRRVHFKPNTNYFKPAGVRMMDLEESILTVDEFESIRLSDLEGLNQEKAAKKMNISQSTFNRLVVGAHKKIADAIVNGKAIKIEGGNYNIVGKEKGITVNCKCPGCGEVIPKAWNVPCARKKCPNCGNTMIRGD